MNSNMKVNHFIDILTAHALQQPDRRAFVYLEDGKVETDSLTYLELHLRACAIATQLIHLKASGERVILVYPPGLDFVAGFMGCLYAGAIAVPTYPPHPSQLKRTLPRFRAIAADSKPVIALTNTKTAMIAKLLSFLLPETRPIKWLATDRLDIAKNELQWLGLSKKFIAKLDADTPAFIQYTSGSTAAPKGVIITHGNLMHNSKEIYKRAKHHSNSVYVSWLPTYHDMGLIGGILQPLYGGFLGVLMSPLAFLKHPVRWLEVISRYRGTTSPFPNFALDLCVRKTVAEKIKGIDLNSWTLASNGGEPIRPETLKNFTEMFKQYGFKNESHFLAYGLAEVTLLATVQMGPREPFIKSFDKEALARGRALECSPGNHARTLVSCGPPIPDQHIAIVNPETHIECDNNIIGEIWISGPSVAIGYWNNKEATLRTFQARIAYDSSNRTFLRTGDLGFLFGTELFITGRIKDVIIIRGRNIYPQDIEQTVIESHPTLRPGCCAAFSMVVEGTEVAGVVVEFEPNRGRINTRNLHHEPNEVIKAIRRTVFETHDIDLHMITLLKVGTIPKTSSGKIQRHAARIAFEKRLLAIHTQWEKQEEVYV